MALLRSVSKLSLILLGSSLGLSCLAMEAIASPSSDHHHLLSNPLSDTAVELAQINIQIGGETESQTDVEAEVEVNIDDSGISNEVSTTHNAVTEDVVGDAIVSDEVVSDEVVSDGVVSDAMEAEAIASPEPQTTVSSGPIQISVPQPSIPQPSINVGPAQVTFPGTPEAPVVPSPSVETPQPTISQPAVPQPTISQELPNGIGGIYPNLQVPNVQVPNAQIPNAQIPNAQIPNAQVPTPGYPATSNPNPGQPSYPHGVVIPSNTQIISPQPTVINMGVSQPTTPTQTDATIPATTTSGVDGNVPNVQLVCSAAGQSVPYGAPIYHQPYGTPVYGNGVPAPGQPYPHTPQYPGTQLPGTQLPGTQFINAPVSTTNSSSSSDLSGWAQSVLAVANPQVGVELGPVDVNVPIPVGAIAGSLLGGNTSAEPASGYAIDPNTGYAIDPNTGYLIEPTTGYLIHPATGQPIQATYPTASPTAGPTGYPTGYPTAAPTGYPTGHATGYPVVAPGMGAVPPMTPGTTQVFTSHPTVINVAGATDGGTLPASATSSGTPQTAGVQLICNPGASAPANGQYVPASSVSGVPTSEVEEEESSSGGGILGDFRPTVGVDVGPFTIGVPVPLPF